MESATAIVTIAPSAVIACGSWKIARWQIGSRPPIIQNFKSDAARNSRGPPACPQGRDETRKELDDTLTFIRDIDRACNPAEVCNVILKAVKSYGFTNVLAGTIPIPGSTKSQQESNIVLAQWLSGWAERYFSNGYLFVDPAIRRVTSDISPFLWSELDPFCRNDPIAARVMNEAGATYAFGHALNLRIQKDEATQARITKREREVLQWAAAGKTEWEIGKILNISEHTVDKFFRTARVKLRAANRTQAVAERFGET